MPHSIFKVYLFQFNRLSHITEISLSRPVNCRNYHKYYIFQENLLYKFREMDTKTSVESESDHIRILRRRTDKLWLIAFKKP